MAREEAPSVMACAPPYRSERARGCAVTHSRLISTLTKGNRRSTKVCNVKVIGGQTTQKGIVSMLKTRMKSDNDVGSLHLWVFRLKRG